jgi:hypothetical protein
MNSGWQPSASSSTRNKACWPSWRRRLRNPSTSFPTSLPGVPRCLDPRSSRDAKAARWEFEQLAANDFNLIPRDLM